MKCESEHLPPLNQWSCSSPDYTGSNDLQIEPTESSRFTVKPVPSKTEFSQSEDEGNTDLFSGSILNSEMRQRRPSRSILQSPERERLSREKSVVWKDNLVEYRYIDGNPVDRGLVNWGSVCYAVLLIVTSYVVYCLLHSVGIKPRGLRPVFCNMLQYFENWALPVLSRAPVCFCCVLFYLFLSCVFRKVADRMLYRKSGSWMSH